MSVSGQLDRIKTHFRAGVGGIFLVIFIAVGRPILTVCGTISCIGDP